MNGRKRWASLMQFLNDNPNCTNDEIVEFIERVKKGLDIAKGGGMMEECERPDIEACERCNEAFTSINGETICADCWENTIFVFPDKESDNVRRD